MSWKDRPWKTGFATALCFTSFAGLFANAFAEGPFVLECFFGGVCFAAFIWAVMEYSP